MFTRSIRLLASVTAVLALAPSLSAQNAIRGYSQKVSSSKPGPIPRLADGKPDLQGIWTVESDNRFFGQRDQVAKREAAVTPAEEAMKPEMREKFNAQLQAGKQRSMMRDVYDPAIRACAPFGTARTIQQGRPFEIIQIPGRVIFRYEQDHWIRDIWMDGRQHPKDLLTTWMGHSIGRWDGDTLVVETVGFNGLTWLDSPGHPHSDQLRLEERYQRLNQTTLEVQVTVDDPGIYTRPVVANKFIFGLLPGDEIPEWVVCEDRLMLHLETDPCEITGAWEYEPYCNRRKKGLPGGPPQDSPPPNAPSRSY